MTDIRNEPIETPAAPAGRSMLQWGAIAWVISAVLTAAGTFWDLTDNESGENGSDELVGWLIMMAVLGAIAFAVYRFWFTAAAQAEVAPNTVLVAGALAFVTVAAFWSGLPAIFAVGALVLGRRGGGPKATIGTVLALLAVAGAVWLAIAG